MIGAATLHILVYNNNAMNTVNECAEKMPNKDNSYHNKTLDLN